jgi:hypothetical protein
MRVLGPVPEHSTALLVATLLDERKTIIEQARLSSLTVTLFDLATGTIINGRSGTSILSDPLLHIYAVETEIVPGVFRSMDWELTPDDNVLVGTSSQERHRLLLRFGWNAGAREYCAPIDFDVHKATV